MTSTEAPISQQEIIGTYRQMQSEMQGMIQQLTKIEMERNEHAWDLRFVRIIWRVHYTYYQYLTSFLKHIE